MVVGICQITLHLPECHSLKDKRQVIKSLMARIRHQFEVAIAEVEEHDRWHSCECGCELDRDTNAAINILQVGRTQRRATCVEAPCL